MLSEEVEGERPGALRDTVLQGSSPGGVGDDVRTCGIDEKILIFDSLKKCIKKWK